MTIDSVRDLFECFHDKYFYTIYYYDLDNKRGKSFDGGNNDKEMNLKFLEEFGSYKVRDFAYYIDTNAIYLEIENNVKNDGWVEITGDLLEPLEPTEKGLMREMIDEYIAILNKENGV